LKIVLNSSFNLGIMETIFIKLLPPGGNRKGIGNFSLSNAGG
jgi:hypothetical protein